jgi:MFS family permease
MASPRQSSSRHRVALAGFILASALITLDGTAANIALPAIGRELSLSVSRLQWISNAPLLTLAALLLPAGAIADRYGRVRVIRIGVIGFGAASFACAAAASGAWLIAGRLLQGAAAALILPAVLAELRAAYADAAERARMFGVWAAWTGVASAAGPLVGGGLVDLASWRAVFVTSGATAVAAALLLLGGARTASRPPRDPVPVIATVALTLLLGGLAYVLIEGPSAEWRTPGVLSAGVLAAISVAVLVRSPKRHLLFPRELVTAANCLPANAATFALYFGTFGLSFLLVLYTQQVLDYSGTWAAVALLPVSVMLFLAEPFGRLATRFGTRTLIMTGALVSAAGIVWMAAGPHPLPFWSRMMLGTAMFGLGISLAVSALTHAAVAAVPETCSGAASGLNHAAVRTAGLVSIALLGSLAAPGQSEAISVDGFRRAMMVCGIVVAVGGVASTALMKDEEPGGLETAQST